MVGPTLGSPLGPGRLPFDSGLGRPSLGGDEVLFQLWGSRDQVSKLLFRPGDRRLARLEFHLLGLHESPDSCWGEVAVVFHSLKWGGQLELGRSSCPQQFRLEPITRSPEDPTGSTGTKSVYRYGSLAQGVFLLPYLGSEPGRCGQRHKWRYRPAPNSYVQIRTWCLEFGLGRSLLDWVSSSARASTTLPPRRAFTSASHPPRAGSRP